MDEYVSPTGVLRSQIGAAKGRLLHLINTESEEIGSLQDVEDSSEKEVLDEIVLVTALGHRIQNEVNHLERYDAEWTAVIAKDRREQKFKDGYITNYGEYTNAIAQAKLVLKDLETKYRQFVDVHKKLSKVPVTYPSLFATDKSSMSSQAAAPMTIHTDPITIHVPSNGQPTVVPAMLQEQSGQSVPPGKSVPTGQFVLPGQFMPPGQFVPPAPVQSAPPVQSGPTVHSVSTGQQMSVEQLAGQFSQNVSMSQQPQMVSYAASSVPYGFESMQSMPSAPCGQSAPPMQPMGYPVHPNGQSFYQYSYTAYDPPLLPPSIPTFNGDPIQYQPFIELFSSMVDIPRYQFCTRLRYLNQALQGEAKNLIQHLPLVESNYYAARKIIHDRYGNPVPVRHKLFCQLQDLPDMKLSPNATIKDVSKFHTDASSIFYALRNIDPETDNSTIADMLMRKLPEKFIAFLVTGRNANRRYTASQLLEVLNSCIQEKSLVATYCENSTNHSAGSKKTTTMSVQQSRPLQQNPQKSGGRFAQRSRDNQVKTPCAFCSDTANYHRHAECPVYKTVEERTKKAQQERLCFKCLIHGHRGNNCPRSRPCFHCRGGHHTALCSVKDHVTPPGRQQPQGQPQGNRQSFKSNKPQDKKFTGPRNPSPRRDINFQQKRVQFANTSVVTSSDTGDLPMCDDEVAVSFTTSSIPLHVTTFVPAEVPENATPDVQNSPPCILRTTDKSLPVAMMTAQVMVDDEQGEPVKAAVFFDNGSDRSYIHRQLAENLQLEALDSKHLLIQKFAEKEATATNSNRYVVTFNIKDKKIPIILTETPMIVNSLTSGQLNEQSIRDLLHDATAILPRTTEHPEILIGLDYMGQILGNTTSTRLPNGTTIHSTDCGFIITGTESQQPTVEQALETTASFPQDQYYCSTINVSTSPEGILSVDPEDEHAALKSLVERLWSLDSAGIFDNPRTTDEEITAKFFADTTTRDDTGRYVCRWPYKNADATDMPDNRYLALHRLESTSRRLGKDMKLYHQYGEIIEEQLRRGFIEIVEDETAATGRVHYLSHHPIIKQSSQTTKVRIVYDASARSRKGALSLNDMLHTGESLLPQLHGILMRCRQPQILISSDIEKAFLMLGLHEEDRDVTRFLWKPPGQDKILCYRFRRVPFGIKTSPYLLNATIKLHLSNINNPMANTMIRNIYVDNVFYGVDSVAEGLEFYSESRKMFDQAKMNLTQFMSNSEAFDRLVAAIENREMTVQPNQKLLGVCWNTVLDVLQVGIPSPIKLPLTKRRILQHVASAFDPIGLIAPVTIKGKLYFQTLWSASKNWDSPLTAAEVNAWKSIEKDICGEPIIVRRRYFNTPTTAEHVFELHIFGDASDLAYGSVAYLRRIGKSSKDIVLLTAKARVSPLKKALTIPMAELLAIERCCQLAKTLIEELDFKIKNVYIWSDSMCCLDQIASQQARTTYGRNRLRNINQLSPPDTVFTRIAGKLNPADVLSRGCALEFLRNYELWWNPFFLLMDQLPIKTSSVVPSITAMSVTEVEELLNLDPHRFSSFVRLFNVIARIINLVEKDENAVRLKATRAIVKLAQQLNPPCEQTIKNLSLDKDNGLWYFQGRIPQRRVYFLPAHHIAKLYVQHVHRLHKHSSVLYTMAKVRNEVCIPKGQSFIKKTIRDCRLCQVIHARPTYQPDFPNLPSIRITWSIPFTICGMDYAGPINATNLGNTRKYWFLVYTCLTTRYTVIDLVCSMDADQLLCSLRRMCSQYGTPQEIRTDNGSQFKMLSKVMLEAKHQLNTSHKLPVFRFIAALSPWSGGVHERMVGLVKRSLLRAGTTKRLLSEEDLRTLLKEVEAVINDRPLTYVSDTDISPIRPVNFVFPNKRQPTVLTIEETLDPSPLASTHQVLLEGWMSTSSIINDFIRRWKEEYVQILQSRTQTVHQQSARATSDQLSVGDVVMVEDDGPQVNWPLARIDELGTRAAKLFVPRTGKTVERPFKKIYQLEVDKPRVEPKKPPVTAPVTAPIASSYTGPTTRARSRSLPGPLSSITLIAMIAMTLLLPPTSAFPMFNIDSSNLDSMFSQFAHLLAYGFLIIIVAVGLHVLLAIFQCSRQLFYIIQCVTFGWVNVVLWICGKICGRRRSRSNSDFILLLLMISLPQSVYMCNNIAHINAEEKACYEHINATQCHINSVSIINVRANGSTSCLEIQHVADKDSKPLLTLKITANALVSYCQKRTVYYSRDFRLTHEYLRRCDSAGSCSADKCGKIAHDEDIEEISQTAKSHPGYTNCAPGCGGWHCSCGWWDPSCLFYRYYALPTSNDIYEIFQCPVWSTRLRITVEIGPSKITTELVPGVKYDLPNRNISITATTIHTPPLQVHSATFISVFATGSNSSRWTSFTFTPPSAPGTPAKGFTGEMQCSTRKDAENFNCQFDRSLCKCVGFSTLVNCQCRNEKMKDHRQTNQLPTKGIHHQVQKINAQVATLAVQDTVVSLHVEIRNATIARMTSVQVCIAKQSGELDGCYSCLQGGYAPISCVSKKPMKAIVDCGTITTSFDCGPFGQSNQLQLPSNQPGVHLNCSIDCGTRTFLTIEGELAGLQAYDNNSTYYASPYQRVIESSLEFGNFVMDVFGKLTGWLRFPLFILGMAVALVSMPYLLRCFVSRKIQSRRQLILLQRSKYM